MICFARGLLDDYCPRLSALTGDYFGFKDKRRQLSAVLVDCNPDLSLAEVYARRNKTTDSDSVCLICTV